MTDSSLPREAAELLLDEQTENAITEFAMNVVIAVSEVASATPTEGRVAIARAALRARVAQLVESARMVDARRTDDFLRALEGELSYEGWEIVKDYLVTETATRVDVKTWMDRFIELNAQERGFVVAKAEIAARLIQQGAKGSIRV